MKQDTLHHQALVPPVVEQPDIQVEAESQSLIEAPLSVEEVSESESQRQQATYEVLKQLPSHATLAQQDSAIQAIFTPEIIRKAVDNDSLGQARDSVVQNKDSVAGFFPLYYKENFFSASPLYHPEISGRYGVAGDPTPYCVRNDNLVTGLLLGCLVLTLVAFSYTRSYILYQIKTFFHYPRDERATYDTPESTGEVKFQLVLLFQWALLCSIIVFFYTQQNIADTFILQSQYQLIGIFVGCFLSFYLIRAGLYTFVNNVFFDGKKNQQWQRAQLFLTSMEGVVLFPLVMLQSYFGLSIQNVLIYATFVLIIVKLLTIYKSFVIFFQQRAAYLQNILYFCALEIVPVSILLGIMTKIVDILKINF